MRVTCNVYFLVFPIFRIFKLILIVQLQVSLQTVKLYSRELANPKVTSRLVWEWHEEMSVLAYRNRLTPYLVNGHTRITGNESADTDTGDINSIQEWVNKNHKHYWESIPAKSTEYPS